MFRKLKRKIAFLQVSILLVLSVIMPCDPVQATASPQIHGESVTGSQGNEITVPIKISGNEGIMGFQIKIDYDEEYVTPVRVKNGTLLAGVFDHNMDTKNTSDFDVMWSGSDAMKEDGVLFEIVFQVSDYAKRGSTEIGISYSQEDTFDESYRDVTLDCSSVNITIEGEPKETEPPTPTIIPTVPPEGIYTISADAIEAEAGKTISIPVNLQGNIGIMGFLMVVKYDVDVFEPISVVKGEVIPEGTNFDDNCETALGDSFKILWSGIDEIDTNGCLFTLNFKVKEGAAVSDSVIELSYKQSDTFDGTYQDVALTCKPIQVGITKNATEEPTATPSETGEPTATPLETGEPTAIPLQTQTPTPTRSPDQQQGITNPTATPDQPKKKIENDIPIVFPKVDPVKPQQVKIKKVKAKGKRKIEVKWKKQKNIKGYQLQYATNKKFKKKKSKNLKASKGSIILKKLKSKKKYYIRIRSYKLYNSKRVYSKWSKVKKCKVK